MQLQAQFQQLQTQQLAAIYAVAQQLARHACSATPLDPQALAEMRRSLVARCMAAKSLQALHPPAGGAPPPGSAQPQPSTPHPQAAGGAAQPSLGAAQPSLDWLGSAGSREWPPPAPPSAEQHLEPDGRQEGAQQEQSHVAELQAGEQAGEDPEQQQQDPAGERESKEYWAGVLRKLVPRLRRNPAAAAKFKQLI